MIAHQYNFGHGWVNVYFDEYEQIKSIMYTPNGSDKTHVINMRSDITTKFQDTSKQVDMEYIAWSLKSQPANKPMSAAFKAYMNAAILEVTRSTNSCAMPQARIKTNPTKEVTFAIGLDPKNEKNGIVNDTYLLYNIYETGERVKIIYETGMVSVSDKEGGYYIYQLKTKPFPTRAVFMTNLNSVVKVEYNKDIMTMTLTSTGATTWSGTRQLGVTIFRQQWPSAAPRRT
jgi:hypothetical protein